MMGTGKVTVRSARIARLRVRAAPWVLTAAIVALAVTGAISALRGREHAPHGPAAAATADPALLGYAESFAAAYLEWDARSPDRHEARLATYLSQSGLTAPPHGVSRVLATRIAQVRAGDRPGGWVITVLTQTNRGAVYLAVPVQRRGGYLQLSSTPAIVGPPASRPGAAQPDEPAVEQAALREVATRALGNYLAAKVTDLKADLAPQALISVPDRPLRLDAVEGLTWSAPGTLALAARVTDLATQAQYALRYELDVVHRERWYVLAIETNPTS